MNRFVLDECAPLKTILSSELTWTNIYLIMPKFLGRVLKGMNWISLVVLSEIGVSLSVNWEILLRNSKWINPIYFF